MALKGPSFQTLDNGTRNLLGVVMGGDGEFMVIAVDSSQVIRCQIPYGNAK